MRAKKNLTYQYFSSKLPYQTFQWICSYDTLWLKMEQRDWRQWKQQQEWRPQWLERHWSVWSGVSETWRYPPSPWRLSAAAAVAAPSLLSEIKGNNSKACVSQMLKFWIYQWTANIIIFLQMNALYISQLPYT